MHNLNEIIKTLGPALLALAGALFGVLYVARSQLNDKRHDAFSQVDLTFQTLWNLYEKDGSVSKDCEITPYAAFQSYLAADSQATMLCRKQHTYKCLHELYVTALKLYNYEPGDSSFLPLEKEIRSTSKEFLLAARKELKLKPLQLIEDEAESVGDATVSHEAASSSS